MPKTAFAKAMIYLPPELHMLLREMAVKRRTTMSELVRQAILAWLDAEARRE